MDLKETYNKIAEDWHKEHGSDNWWVDATNKFISLLGTGAIVLDVGCGSGHKAKYLIKNGLNVVGLDFSEKMIEIAKREVSEAEFIVMDLRNINKLDREFDGIHMQAVLLHIPKKEAPNVLKNVVGRLKNGGYIYLGVKEIKPGQPEEEIKAENDYGYEYSRTFSYFTMDEIKKYLADLNMKICHEEIGHGDSRHWIQVVAQK